MKNLLLTRLSSLRIVVVSVLISSSMGLFAQPIPVQNFGVDPRATTYRKSFWTEYDLCGTLSKNGRWQYQVDLQYRTMADANYIQGGQTGNVFKEHFQTVFRPWIHYWIIPGVLKFSLSPIGYWFTSTPSAETALYPNKNGVTTGQSVYPEFRMSPQIMTHQHFGRVQFINRFRYEFRFIGERTAAGSDLSFNFDPTDVGSQSASLGWYGNNQQGRMRIQTRLQFPLNNKTIEAKTWYVNMWNEVFLAIGPHVKNNKLLNQNRIVGLLGYRFKGEVPIRIETGFTYQTVFSYNIDTPPTNPSITYQNSNVDNNFAYTIYLIFDEFHRFFIKKNPEGANKH